MSVYLGKEKKFVTATMATTQATVMGLTTRIEYFWHELYI
jgi:hypothetical protein